MKCLIKRWYRDQFCDWQKWKTIGQRKKNQHGLVRLFNWSWKRNSVKVQVDQMNEHWFFRQEQASNYLMEKKVKNCFPGWLFEINGRHFDTIIKRKVNLVKLKTKKKLQTLQIKNVTWNVWFGKECASQMHVLGKLISMKYASIWTINRSRSKRHFAEQVSSTSVHIRRKQFKVTESA